MKETEGGGGGAEPRGNASQGSPTLGPLKAPAPTVRAPSGPGEG